MNHPFRTLVAVAALAVLPMVTAPLQAADATVNAVGVKFEPMTVYIEPGESVSWTNMAGHNVETLGAMIPDGGTELNSELGVDISATFETPGIYVYKCTPHWGSRMGGVIVVGQPDDAQATLDAYTAAIEEDRAGLLPAKGLLKKAAADMEENGML